MTNLVASNDDLPDIGIVTAHKLQDSCGTARMVLAHVINDTVNIQVADYTSGTQMQGEATRPLKRIRGRFKSAKIFLGGSGIELAIPYNKKKAA